ncbi:MAG: hypothetical protein Q9195_006589 [Heterodermia aff. obscurata]
MHELRDHAVICKHDVVRFTRANKPKGIVSKLWQSSRQEVLRLNFYRVLMAYFLITILLSSVILYGSGIVDDPTEDYGGHLEYMDALFLCTSAMTATGLATVNLNILTAFQQALLAILILLGNVVFVSVFVVIIRRHFTQRELNKLLENSKAGCKVKIKVDEEEANCSTEPASGLGLSATLAAGCLDDVISRSTDNAVQPTHSDNSSVRSRRTSAVQPSSNYEYRRSHHQTGLGFLPAPWQISGVRKAFHWLFRRTGEQPPEKNHQYFSFVPALDVRGRIHSLNEHEREELGGVEYRALGVLAVFLILYLLGWLMLGTVFLVPYSYRAYVKNTVITTQAGYVMPGCHVCIVFQSTYYILIIVGALSLVGNTQFPVLLRFFIWATSKCTPPNSGLRPTLLFLLHHPRRPFSERRNLVGMLGSSISPSPNPDDRRYLFGTQLGIQLFIWLLFEVLNLGVPYVMEMPLGTRAAVGLFQALGVHTGGFFAVDISSLAPALQIAYTVAMYISSLSVFMAVRQTNAYEEESIGLDSTNLVKGGHLLTHLQNQLAYDMWFLIGAWFLICAVERTALMESHPGVSIFNILFEVTSGYGTVGVSTGVPYDAYSLSGAFHKLSKVIMLFVMMRGRLRGLPLAIDRSILIPGEELFHRMDEMYNRRSKMPTKDEKVLQRNEEEREVK